MGTLGSSSFTFWSDYVAINLMAACLFWSSVKYPNYTKAVSFEIFIAAAAVNTHIALDSTWAYHDYADTSKSAP